MVATLSKPRTVRPDVCPGPTTPAVYAETDIYPQSNNTVDSYALAYYSDCWGNTVGNSLSGNHYIISQDRLGSTFRECWEPVSSETGRWDGHLLDARENGYCYWGWLNAITSAYGGFQPLSTTVQSATQCFSANGIPDPNPSPIPGADSGTTWFDPLVLDLNGDGVRTTGIDQMVWFDVDGDGKREQVTWTSPDSMEAFLWINLNRKNRVDNGRELFGEGTTLPDGNKATNGFQALAVYDTPAYGGNGDGQISASDAVWNHLRLWIDADHDGKCDPGETGPIHRYGIESIPLTAVTTNLVDGAGNVHQLQGHYYLRNGQARLRLAIDSMMFRAAVP